MEVENSSKIKVQGREGTFLKPSSKHEKYELRPYDGDDDNTDAPLYNWSFGALNAISFAQFCMVYEPKSIAEMQKIKKIQWSDFNEELGAIAETSKEENRTVDDAMKLPKLLTSFKTGYPLPQWIRLRGKEERYMKLRSSAYILRIYNGIRKDPIEDLYSQLLLYSPWRNEQKINPWSDTDTRLKKDVLDFKKEREAAILEMFEDEAQDDANVNLITENENTKNMIYPFSKKLGSIKELLEKEDFQRSSTIYDSINPNAEQQNEDESEFVEPLDLTEDFPDEEFPQPYKSRKNQNKQGSMKVEKSIFKPMILPETMEEMYNSVRSLSFEQRVIFDRFIHFLQSIVCVKNNGDIEPIPPRLIVHGNKD